MMQSPGGTNTHGRPVRTGRLAAYWIRLPQASWGNLTQSAMELVPLTTRPWAWLPPGLCIVATGLALLLVGEGLRKALNPRNR